MSFYADLIIKVYLVLVNVRGAMAKKKNNLFIFPLILSVLFVLLGSAMLTKELTAYGFNTRTLKLSGLGGHLLILIGIIFLIVSYYSLSPFGRIRNFNFTRFNRKRKKRSNKCVGRVTGHRSGH